MGTYSGGSRRGDASPTGIQQFFAREKYRKLLQPEAIFWLKCMKERLAIGFLRGPRRGAYSAPSNLLADLAGFKGAASLQGRTRKGRHGSNKRERKMDHPPPCQQFLDAPLDTYARHVSCMSTPLAAHQSCGRRCLDNVIQRPRNN